MTLQPGASPPLPQGQAAACCVWRAGAPCWFPAREDAGANLAQSPGCSRGCLPLCDPPLRLHPSMLAPGVSPASAFGAGDFHHGGISPLQAPARAGCLFLRDPRHNPPLQPCAEWLTLQNGFNRPLWLCPPWKGGAHQLMAPRGPPVATSVPGEPDTRMLRSPVGTLERFW